MKLLLIEDEASLAKSLIKGLKEEGFVVDWSPVGKKGLFMAKTQPYDLLVLDWMLPDITGLEIIQELRQEQSKLPILILTAKEELEFKIEGLEAGADDYLTKPFDFNELIARIRAILRRPINYREEIIRIGELSLNLTTKEVKVAGIELKLSPKEYSLLEVLARHPNQVLSRDQLLEQAWDHNYEGFSNVVDVYIRYLRNKLKLLEKKKIATVRGFGYKLDLER